MTDLKEKILHGALKSLETVPIDKLKKIIRISEEEKREYGFAFCGTTDVPPFGDISHSDLCTGTDCRVDIKDCKGSNQLSNQPKLTAKGKKQIGTFHTHPHTKNAKDIGNLSGEDIYQSVSHKHSFSCIGFVEKDKPVLSDKSEKHEPVLSDKSEKHKPIIKCFIPTFDIDPFIALKAYRTQDNYSKQLSKASEEKPNITEKSIDELIKAYNEQIIADDELYQSSKSLAEKLSSKEADLTIN